MFPDGALFLPVIPDRIILVKDNKTSPIAEAIIDRITKVQGLVINPFGKYVRLTKELLGFILKEFTENWQEDTEYESFQDRDKNWKRRFQGYKYVHRMKIEFPADNQRLGKIISIDYSWGEIDFVSKPLQEMSLRCCAEDAVVLLRMIWILSRMILISLIP